MSQATPIPVLLVGEALHIEHLALLHDGWQATVATADDIPARDMSRHDILVVDADPASDTAQATVAAARNAGFTGPVLYLTERKDVSGVTGIGDAFLTRPYSVEQLAASLRELARHAPEVRGGHPDPIIRVGDIALNEDTHEVHRGDAPLALSGTEYELLRFLMRNPGRAHSKAQILDRVWPLGSSSKHSVVELYISYLRKHVDEGRAEPMLVTVYGVGYRLNQSAITR